MEHKLNLTPGKGGCPAAGICPFRTICYLYADESTDPLRPSSYSVKKGEVLITNPGAESYVYVFQDGFFVSYGEAEQGIEVPFAILGEGITAGVAELYTTEKIGDTYHFKALLPGSVCTLSKSAVKKKLASLPREDAHKIVCCALMNQFTSVFALMKVRGKAFIYDQILAILLYFRALALRRGSENMTFEITQDELAQLIGANRMAVSRVLKKMHGDGLIDYSYKSITLNSQKLSGSSGNFSSYFITLDDNVEFLDNFEDSYLADDM